MPTDRVTQRKGKKIGRFYGVGVGPGDPELLTLKAQRVLNDVPVIFVPQKSNDNGSIAKSIITCLSPEIKSKCAGIIFPMLKDEQKLRKYWRQAADIILCHLNQGTDCAFVNVGDPLFYGTFIHILKVLQKKHPEIEVEIIPGVSSVNAAAARSVIPLASDDDNIAVISGNQTGEMIRDTLNSFDTVVFLKVNKVFEKLLGILKEMNLQDKSVYVRRCTTGEEEIIWDIGSLKGRKLDYFSLLIVRK